MPAYTMPASSRPFKATSAQKKLPNLFAEVSLALAEKIFRLVLQSQIKLNRERGVVERFIAPVLKTGDPSRGPGVRIPPPLPTSYHLQPKARILYEFELFSF